MNIEKLKVMLAPLERYSDSCFRLLCEKLGADLTFIPMISVNSINNENFVRKIIKESKISKAIQLFGRDLNLFIKSINLFSKYFKVININLGCPSFKIIKQGYGAALLRDLKSIRNILKEIRKNYTGILSVKTRIGFDKINIYEQMKIYEKYTDFVIIHGRTAKQGFRGKNNWKLIKEVALKSKIPVIGNGDIFTYEDYVKYKSYAHGICIGRGALINPLIFKEIKTSKRISDVKQKVNVMLEYVNCAEKNIPFSVIKLHFYQFFKGFKKSKYYRTRLNSCNKVEDIRKLIYELI